MHVISIKRILLILNILICCHIYIIYGEELKIKSPSAIVMEVSSGRVLYAKNIQDKRKIASTTKLMTAMVVMDNCKLSDTVEVSKCAAGTRWLRGRNNCGRKNYCREFVIWVIIRKW